jgi:hypothetical protein
LGRNLDGTGNRWVTEAGSTGKVRDYPYQEVQLV